LGYVCRGYFMSAKDKIMVFIVYVHIRFNCVANLLYSLADSTAWCFCKLIIASDPACVDSNFLY